jgi:hypothetical protein
MSGSEAGDLGDDRPSGSGRRLTRGGRCRPRQWRWGRRRPPRRHCYLRLGEYGICCKGRSAQSNERRNRYASTGTRYRVHGPLHPSGPSQHNQSAIIRARRPIFTYPIDTKLASVSNPRTSAGCRSGTRTDCVRSTAAGTKVCSSFGHCKDRRDWGISTVSGIDPAGALAEKSAVC